MIFANAIGRLETSRLTDDFPDAHIKKIILVGGFEHQGGIGTAAGSPDGNDIIAAKGAGVCSHHRHFYRNLDTLTKEPQRVGHN